MAAAEYAAARLAEVGIESELFTTTAPHRAGISALIPGTDATAEPLLLTGHLDVVPAVAADWTHRRSRVSSTTTACCGAAARGHEGHGRDDPRRGAPLGAYRHQPRRPVAILLTPDEGGRRSARGALDRQPPP